LKATTLEQAFLGARLLFYDLSALLNRGHIPAGCTGFFFSSSPSIFEQQRRRLRSLRSNSMVSFQLNRAFAGHR